MSRGLGDVYKRQVISRSPNAGGGKSGALNYALKFTHGEWLLVLDADAELKQDSLIMEINYLRIKLIICKNLI